MSQTEVPSVELHKFPKIKYPNDPATNGLWGNDVVVTEKLDGANFRFTWNSEGQIVFGSRNVKFTEEGEPLPLDDVSSAFRHSVEAVRAIVPPASELSFDPERFTFFGESMQLHSLQYDGIDYTAAESGPPFPNCAEDSAVLFDAWDHEAGSWVDWGVFRELVDELGLQRAREIAFGDREFLEDNNALEIPTESMFGGHPEGIVARRWDGAVRAKRVSEDFKEKNATAFNDPSKAEGDAAEFVAMFVTPARVKKNAHKLVDEGEYDSLKMPMMEDLPEAVIRDIFEEEGWNLICDEYGFEADFDDEFKDEVRRRTSTACSRELKSEINAF